MKVDVEYQIEIYNPTKEEIFGKWKIEAPNEISDILGDDIFLANQFKLDPDNKVTIGARMGKVIEDEQKKKLERLERNITFVIWNKNGEIRIPLKEQSG